MQIITRQIVFDSIHHVLIVHKGTNYEHEKTAQNSKTFTWKRIEMKG